MRTWCTRKGIIEGFRREADKGLISQNSPGIWRTPVSQAYTRLPPRAQAKPYRFKEERSMQASTSSKRKWSEVDSSDEDEPSLGKQVLPVANLPADFSGDPEDGLQYLFLVRYVVGSPTHWIFVLMDRTDEMLGHYPTHLEL